MKRLEIGFIVDGEPLPKQSFRIGVHGGYTPARVASWQAEVAIRAKEAMRGGVPFEGPVSVLLEFRRKSRRRCDIDNLSKAVLDAIQGIVYGNDDQVAELCARKFKHSAGRVYVRVRVADGGEE
jgi:Holliday junction resolvase RusA-like endonuclease